jgi:hypothetical protein
MVVHTQLAGKKYRYRKDCAAQSSVPVCGYPKVFAILPSMSANEIKKIMWENGLTEDRMRDGVKRPVKKTAAENIADSDESEM